MAAGDKFLAEVSVDVLLTCLRDPEAIRYRQRVLADCLAQPDVIRQMYEVATGQIRPRCLMLFNESFAGTNEREGSEIGYQIVRALLDAGVKVFFVTHRFSFADRFHRQSRYPALFLRAERQPDGHRSYKLTAKDPSRPATAKTSTTGSAAGWMKTKPFAGNYAPSHASQ